MILNTLINKNIYNIMKGKHYKIEIVSMGQSDGKYPTRNYSST